jgi:hypothetical protein
VNHVCPCFSISYLGTDPNLAGDQNFLTNRNTVLKL